MILRKQQDELWRINKDGETDEVFRAGTAPAVVALNTRQCSIQVALAATIANAQHVTRRRIGCQSV